MDNQRDKKNAGNAIRHFGFAALLTLAFGAGIAKAETLDVVSSGGLATSVKALAAAFEKQSGDHLNLEWGPSMGTTVNAVPVRLARGEKIDVTVMVGDALGDLAKKGKIEPGSRVDIAQSGIGIVVKAGTPHPDVATVDALRRTLLAAKSIAYSDSASGVYIQNEMFKKLGIENEVKDKARMIPAEPVGAVVARGEAEIGFQQMSELKPIKGIDILGPVPGAMQKMTVFSAGIVAGSKHAAAARAFIAYLASPEARATITDAGLLPMH